MINVHIQSAKEVTFYAISLNPIIPFLLFFLAEFTTTNTIDVLHIIHNY